MHTERLLSQSVLVLVTLALFGCSADAPVTYAGDLTPTAGTCDPPGRAVLIRRGHYIQFTPRQGVLILDGQVSPAGQIAAETTAPGADRKPYCLALSATLSGQTVSGTYVTPRCRYTVEMRAAP